MDNEKYLFISDIILTTKKLIFFVAYYSIANNKYNILMMDFSKSLNNECKMWDYLEYSPGKEYDSCYNGQNKIYYKRIHKVECLNIYENLPKTSSSICQCDIEDFNCQYELKIDKGECRLDKDLNYDIIFPSCERAERYTSDLIKSKSPYNKCSSNYYDYRFLPFRICNLNENLNILTYRTIDNLNYISFDNDLYVGSIPCGIENINYIISYDIDVLSRNIFFITEEGFFKFCWGNQNIDNSQLIKLSNNKNGNNIRYDNVGKILYVSDKLGIQISVFPFKEYTYIVESEKISAFDIVSNIGILLYTISIPNGFKLFLCDMLGNYILSKEVKTNMKYSVFNKNDGILRVVMHESELKIMIKNFLITENTTINNDIVLEFYIDNKLYIMVRTQLHQEKRIIADIDPGGQEYRVHLRYSSFNDICQKHSCSHFCIADQESFKCGCPKNMKLYNNYICSKNETIQSKCDIDQFTCDFGRCINVNKLCDNYYNCLDMTDELNCNKYQKVKCRFKCKDKCIKDNQICDGVIDCKNGEDERRCEKNNNCRPPFDMKCLNENKCFNRLHICDDFPDCNKKMEEIYCDSVDNQILNQSCDSFLSYSCKNGRCIPLYKHCDGIKDCLNNEDELSCDIEVNNIKISKMDGNQVVLSWTYFYKITDHFIIKLFEWDDITKMKLYRTNNLYVDLMNLEYCKRYIAVVSLRETVGISLPFVINGQIRKPFNLYYNYTSNLLSWEPIEFCIPHIFYILCWGIKSKKIEFFISMPNFKLPEEYDFCHVATCPDRIFNESCSSYSFIQIKESSKTQKKFSTISFRFYIVIFCFAIIFKSFFIIIRRTRIWSLVKSHALFYHPSDSVRFSAAEYNVIDGNENYDN